MHLVVEHVVELDATCGADDRLVFGDEGLLFEYGVYHLETLSGGSTVFTVHI